MGRAVGGAGGPKFITEHNANEVYDALRDISMMFTDWAEERGVFCDADIWLRFEPIDFIDVTSDGRFHYGDLELVQIGSALALVGRLYDAAVEERSFPRSEEAINIREALLAGRFSHLSQIESVLTEYFNKESEAELNPWFNHAMLTLFERYVRAHFRKLASAKNR